MPSSIKIQYGTFFRYSPKGTTEKGKKSLQICGKLKNGDRITSNKVASYISKNHLSFFEDFFGENTLLVPMPRSAPLFNSEALWPAKIICEEFQKESLGLEVREILLRTSKVPKSSFQNGANNRPSIEEHLKSFESISILIPYNNIVIIDDVLTLGRTSAAAYITLKEQYPDKNISIFSVMRTRSLTDENILIEPQISQMSFNEKSGKVQMPD